MRKYAANALYWKGKSLLDLERWPEALGAFEELVAAAEIVPDDARDWVAKAFSGRGDALVGMGADARAVEAYADGLTALADDDEPSVVAVVEEMMCSQALALVRLGKIDEVVALLDGLVALRAPQEPMYVASAYFLKALLHSDRRDYDAAISTADAAMERFGSSDDRAVRWAVAKCLDVKVNVLKYRGPSETANQAAEQLVNHFGADLDPKIESIVAPHAHRLGRGRSRLRFRGLG